MTNYTRLIIFILALLGMAGMVAAQQTEGMHLCDYLKYDMDETTLSGEKLLDAQTIGYMNDRDATPLQIGMHGKLTWDEYYYSMFLAVRGGNKKQCVTKGAYAVFTFTDSTTLRLNHTLGKFCKDERFFALAFTRPEKVLITDLDAEQENEDVFSYFSKRTVYSIDLHFNKNYSEQIILTDPKVINKQLDCIYFD